MGVLPKCDVCGQSDEFLVTDKGVFICICGHQFKIGEHPQSATVKQLSGYLKTLQPHYIH
ncbi:hypothetical protein C9I89_05875 [Photobacterium lipolyticum]|uniref:Uncharacterized protein n=1 Tax=Photobacterium lipolyticum TaxID=266810 RepID=A0A2T3N168_9GAMM|nr:hypothetical protein C9I89_05875 [Photobacterium lipolyticum]